MTSYITPWARSGVAPFVPCHRDRVVADPDHATVLGERPVLGVEGGPCSVGFVRGQPHPFPIVGMHHFEPSLGVLAPFLGRVPQHRFKLRADVDRGRLSRGQGGVPGVGDGRNLFHHGLEPSFGLAAQRRLVPGLLPPEPCDHRGGEATHKKAPKIASVAARAEVDPSTSGPAATTPVDAPISRATRATATTTRSRHAGGRPFRAVGGFVGALTFMGCIDPFAGSLNRLGSAL